MKLSQYLIEKIILKPFFSIDLSGQERQTALDSIQVKYVPTIRYAAVIGLLVIPSILFLDTNILISVLIPITMVTGTAWYAISLATIKRKFEDFGLVLTASMFKGFVASLVILGLLTVFSFLAPFLESVAALAEHAWIYIIAVVTGTLAVGSILWNMLVGSLQYDINDSMLAGQSEAAEKFYKRSLSLLYAAAENLRSGKALAVANYYLGVSFYEVFQFLKSTGILNGKLAGLMENALKLKHDPDMPQDEADAISIGLIEQFVGYCVNVQGSQSEKCFANIKDELSSLKQKKESQAIVDTRLSVIFEEMAELLELQGESLFRKRKE